MRFRQIEDQRDDWPVGVLCAALSVSSSGHYAWRLRQESPRETANRALLADIQRVHARHRERYGAPRIQPGFVPRVGPSDLRPEFHPGMSRVGWSFEPTWLGAATGRGAEPPIARSVPSRCDAGVLSLA